MPTWLHAVLTQPDWWSAFAAITMAIAAVYAAVEGTRSYRESVSNKKLEMFAEWERRFEGVFDVFSAIDDDDIYPEFVAAVEKHRAVDRGREDVRKRLDELDRALRFLLSCKLDGKIVKHYQDLSSIYRYYWEQTVRSEAIMSYIKKYYPPLTKWPDEPNKTRG